MLFVLILVVLYFEDECKNQISFPFQLSVLKYLCCSVEGERDVEKGDSVFVHMLERETVCVDMLERENVYVCVWIC